MGNTDGDIRFQLQFQGRIGFLPFFEPTTDQRHQVGTEQQTVTMTQIIGTGSEGELLQVLVGIGQFGTKQTDGPGYLYPEHE